MTQAARRSRKRRDLAGPWNEMLGRLQGVDAAIVRWVSQGAAKVAAQVQRAQARSDGGRPSAARAARGPRRVPWIDGTAEDRIVCLDAERKGGRFVLPSTTAPEARMRATTVASTGGT